MNKSTAMKLSFVTLLSVALYHDGTASVAAEDQFSVFSWETVSEASLSVWRPLAPPIVFIDHEGIDYIDTWWDAGDDAQTIMTAEYYVQYPSVYELHRKALPDPNQYDASAAATLARSQTLNKNSSGINDNSTVINENTDYGYYWKHTLVESSAPMNANNVRGPQFWDCFMSGDGTHFVTYKQGGQDKEFVVYNKNASGDWVQKVVLPSLFYDHNEGGSSVEGTDVDLGRYREKIKYAIGISEDGSRLALSVIMYNPPQGEDDDWLYGQYTADGGEEWMYGVRVVEWNGTDYIRLGQTIPLDQNCCAYQMDRSGYAIFAWLKVYQFNSDTRLWEVARTRKNNLPELYSRDGFRKANRSANGRRIAIFQRKTHDLNETWDKIAEIPGGQFGVGYSLAFDESGRTVVTSGGNYTQVNVFQQDNCNNTNPDDAEDVSCTFALVGNLPCLGCGKVKISSDGKRVLMSYNEFEVEQYSGFSTIISFERPDGPQPKEEPKSESSTSSPWGSLMPSLSILVATVLSGPLACF